MGTPANWVGDASPGLGDHGTIAIATNGGAIPSSISMGANRTFGNLIFGGASAAATNLPATLSITTNSSGGTTARSLTINSSIVMTEFATGTVSFPGDTNGTISLALGATGTRTFQVASSTASLNFTSPQVISGGAAILKAGLGTLATGTGNTYSGGATLTEGTWRSHGSSIQTSGVINSGPFGTGGLTLSGGTLRSSTTSTRVYHNSVNLGGNVTLGDLTNNGTQTFSTAAGGVTSLTADSTLNVVSTIVWNQAISGAFKLTKTGAGDLTLGASANTFLGGLTISQGALIVDFTAGLGPAAVQNDSAVVINGGTLRYTNATTSSSDASRGFRVGASGGTIDLVDAAKVLTLEAAIKNLDGETGSLTKSGAGKLILSGNSTYTGTTTVSAGSLVVNGNISTSGLTTVASGATLGGSGSVGALTVSGTGTIAPGNSPGILTVNGDYSQSSGTLSLELNGTLAGTDYDQLSVTGTVNLGGLLSVSVGYAPVNDQLLFILLNDGSDAISGTFSGMADLSKVMFGQTEWLISYNADSTNDSFTGGNDIALKAIPEAGAAMLGSVGLLMLVAMRRRPIA